MILSLLCLSSLPENYLQSYRLGSNQSELLLDGLPLQLCLSDLVAERTLEGSWLACLLVHQRFALAQSSYAIEVRWRSGLRLCSFVGAGVRCGAAVASTIRRCALPLTLSATFRRRSLSACLCWCRLSAAISGSSLSTALCRRATAGICTAPIAATLCRTAALRCSPLCTALCGCTCTTLSCTSCACCARRASS